MSPAAAVEAAYKDRGWRGIWASKSALLGGIWWQLRQGAGEISSEHSRHGQSHLLVES